MIDSQEWSGYKVGIVLASKPGDELWGRTLGESCFSCLGVMEVVLGYITQVLCPDLRKGESNHTSWHMLEVRG